MKILVVDDEADVQPMFLQSFRKEIREGKLEFIFALSGEEAIDRLQRAQDGFAMVLSDINMPGMNGIELLSRIRRENETPPPVVLMISAYGDEENYQQAMRRGANDFLTKPINLSSLKEKLAGYDR